MHRGAFGTLIKMSNKPLVTPALRQEDVNMSDVTKSTSCSKLERASGIPVKCFSNK